MKNQNGEFYKQIQELKSRSRELEGLNDEIKLKEKEVERNSGDILVKLNEEKNVSKNFYKCIDRIFNLCDRLVPEKPCK